MVKITNVSGRPLNRRTPSGTLLRWDAGQTRDVESKRLVEQLNNSNGFEVSEEVGKKGVGGGLKTHVRTPKRRSHLDKSRKHLDESKQASKKIKSPKSVIDKIERAINKKKPKSLKKPKGLRKSKRAD